MSSEKALLLGNPPIRVKTCSKYLIAPITFIVYATYGTFMYIIPQYTQSVIKADKLGNSSLENSLKNISACHVNKSSHEYQLNIEIQQDASKWMLIFSLCGGIPSIFSNLIIGSYSDVFGRKIVLMLSVLGCTIKMLICSAVIYFKLHYAYFIIAYFVEGLTGQFMSFASASFGYVADVTAVGKERSFGILLIEVFTGLGVTCGTFSTGFAIKAFGFFWPMFIGGAVEVLCFVSMFFVLQETLQVHNRRKDRSIQGALKNSLKFYHDKSYAGKRQKYIILIACFILLSIALLGRANIEALYQIGPPFCWSSEKVGIFGAMQFFIASLIGMSLAKLLQGCLSDETIGVLGAISGSCSLILEALAQSDTFLYLVPVVNILSIPVFPMVRSLMSVMTPADSQGAMFAGLGTVQTICNMIGQVGDNAVYFATVAIFNGFVFLVLASLMVVTVFLLLFLTIKKNKEVDIQEVRRPSLVKDCSLQSPERTKDQATT